MTIFSRAGEQALWLVASQVWQVAAVALIVALLVRFFCQHRPHLAYLLWMLVLVKCLTPPIWSSPVGVFSWAQVEVEIDEPLPKQYGPAVTDTVVLADTSPLADNETDNEVTGERSRPVESVPESRPNTPRRGEARAAIGWRTIAIVVWISGAAIVFLIVLARLFACFVIVRRASAVTDQDLVERTATLAKRFRIFREVRLLITNRNVGPAVFGLLRPTILLPASIARKKSADELEPILAHELIHFRRGDTQFGWLQVAVQIVWWFHPVVWWASRQATLERERCCDEEAVRDLACEPSVYAQSLIDVLNQKRQLRPLYALPGMRVFEITLRRLEHIMNRSDQFSDRTPRWHWIVCLLVAFAILPGSGFVMKWSEATGTENDDSFPVPNKSKQGEWSQFGGSSHRNNTPDGENVPTDWDYKTKKNIRWSAQLGSSTYCSPVVADGKVFIGTNNSAGHVKEFPASVDLSCLLCFDENDGNLLWQYSIEKLKNKDFPMGARVLDWPMLGLCSVPMVEGKRLWVVTTRCEVVCLDTDGFRDKENDGPFKDEKLKSENDADIIWKFDMMKELGVHPHNLSNCSVTCAGDVLLVGTSNGVDESHLKVPSPDAPSFIAINRNSGKLLWKNNLPGKNILHGQWSSPAYAVIDGVPQVIFAGGDGWMYAFDWRDLRRGKSNLLWWFDCNPKETKWQLGQGGDRNNILSTPVIYDGLVYIAVGQDIEHGEGDGRMWCIDPKKRGDISAELVYNKRDPKTPIAHRRAQACITDEGDFVRKNPNSGVVWEFSKFDRNANGEIEFEEIMHRTVCTPAIKNGLVIMPDTSGLVHCIDAKTGTPYWAYDALAALYGSPLIVDSKVYLGDEDGDVMVFKHSRKLKLIAEIMMDKSIDGSMVYAGESLYIPTKSKLYSITAATKFAKPEPKADRPKTRLSKEPRWKFKMDKLQFEAAPIVSGSAVFAGDLDGNLFRLDRKTGKIVWKFSAGGGFTAEPKLRNGRIYIGDYDGWFYCIDAVTGKEIWSFLTHGEVNGGAAFHENRVIFGSQDAGLYAVDDPTGKLLWKYINEDQIRTTAMVVDDLLAVAGCCKDLTVLEAATARKVASFELGSPTMSSPIVEDKRLYIGTEGGDTFCLAWPTLELKWHFKPDAAQGIRGQPALTKKLVLVSSRNKHVYAINRTTGKLAWKFRAKSGMEASPVVIGDTVYVGANDGRLYGLKLATGEQVYEYEASRGIYRTLGVDKHGVAAAAEDALIYWDLE